MIFVTGGTGLVGSHLLYKLTKSNDNIIALKQKTSNINNVKYIFSIYEKNYEKLFNKIRWINGDIRNNLLLNDITKDISTIYHTAAFVSYNKRHKQKIYDINVNGTKNIVNACLQNNINELCYISSISSLGENNNNPITEETCWKENNNTNYSKSKYLAELEVWRGIAEGLNTIIINPSVILGPGFWNKGSSAIFTTIKNNLKYYTNGSTGFVDVRDVVEILINLKNKKAYNTRFIVSSENINYKDIFIYIAKKLNSKPPKKYATPTLTKIAYNIEHIKSFLLNTNPLITKETAITAHKKLLYSNKKIINFLNFKFIPINDSIDFTSEIFNNQQYTTK